MSRRLRRHMSVRKATRFAVVINALQILAMGGVFGYALLNRVTFLSHAAEMGLLLLCLLIIIWGAVMDIRDAMTAEKIAAQTDMLEEAYDQLEDLNGLLRSQRHDFMNHLQVIFSLMEMKEDGEAMQYIERVYGDILKVGSVLKTSIPAVNALIAAKHGDCDDDGIRFETQIASSWSGLPVSGWEMCRIFGNLIDNARDALLDAGAQDGYIHVALGETPGAFTFSVSNNGPRIPEKHLVSIFQQGFTTKSEGHGSGLSIVSDIMEAYDGTIRVTSDEAETVFSGAIPKPALSSVSAEELEK